MDTYSGNILKMVSIHENPIKYFLPIGDSQIDMNELLGTEIKFTYLGIINCVACGAKTRTSFAQGYCYKCFTTRPETEEDVLHPEKCRAHLGIARDMEWAKKNCLIEHHVYLSDTSQLKVGVTRNHQVPTRWIDQGASQAISLALTPNRYLAGMIEVFYKNHIADKTHWRTMLTNNNQKNVDLIESKQKLSNLLPDEYRQYFNSDDTIYKFNYPIIEKVTVKQSVNFDKKPIFSGRVIGIKGQYLLFDNSYALNIRKYSGYKFDIEV
ncbi:MAG: DUF2797 domain-containing protein [Salinivirgaceae bacterium]|nr:DUF2797 domain-containing protein [Salinivirgaceae bacterium]